VEFNGFKNTVVNVMTVVRSCWFKTVDIELYWKEMKNIQGYS
jgi:hypothetical protein